MSGHKPRAGPSPLTLFLLASAAENFFSPFRLAWFSEQWVI